MAGCGRAGDIVLSAGLRCTNSFYNLCSGGASTIAVLLFLCVFRVLRGSALVLILAASGAGAFQLCACPLLLEAPLYRSGGGSGRSARLHGNARCPDQLEQPLTSILAIARLGAMPMRLDDQHAVRSDLSTRQAHEAPAHIVGQRSGARDVPSQLYRSSDLVDLLAARPGRTDELLRQLILIEQNVIGYAQFADHALTHRGPSRAFAFAAWGSIETLRPDSVDRPMGEMICLFGRGLCAHLRETP